MSTVAIETYIAIALTLPTNWEPFTTPFYYLSNAAYAVSFESILAIQTKNNNESYLF